LALSARSHVERLLNGIALIDYSVRRTIVVNAEITFVICRYLVNSERAMTTLKKAKCESLPVIWIPLMDNVDHFASP